MSQELKAIIREEYIKCVQDPSHFMRKYCNIQHPQRGRIIFNLYPFQSKVLNLWQNNPFSIVLKSRQLGISTLAAGYSLWLMLFHKDKNILCIATKQDIAKNMVTKTKFMFDNLPSWLKIPADENNKLTLKLNNGSQIKATSAASDAGRSEAVSLLIIDEAAFIENIEPIWASAQQTLATGGGAIVLSTPFGTGNWFHKTWVRAESNENDSFLPIKLPWYVHPERDQAWRDKQDVELGDPRLAAQECDCDFSTSGDIVFYPEHLEYYLATHVVEPMERRGVDKNLWIWESPDYSRNYMVVADVARGDGKDYSAFHIFDLETNAQVAEYKSQLSPKEFGYMLVGIATEYNEALLVVENNNIGWATLDAIQEREYRNLYFSSKSDVITADSYFTKYENNANMIPGFTMSLRTRPLAINKGREYLGDHSVIIRSISLIEEMKIFIWKNGRAEAQSGYNDDLIMSFNIAMFVRDTALKYKQQGIELTKATLNSIQRPADYQGAYFASGVDNPYAFKVNGENEDISWLLD